ncbi:MAG TPA: cytochrome c [Opitutaceae bacterium]|nr:cytochrome c [Opitutaceae bacterium]
MRPLFLLALLAAAALPAAGKPLNDHSRGGRLYAQACASCHLPDGAGVPYLQPPLAGDPVIAMDSPNLLIDVILKGPLTALPPGSRPSWPVQMPAFASWPDRDVAALATFLRRVIGGHSQAVTAAQVAARRG